MRYLRNFALLLLAVNMVGYAAALVYWAVHQ